MTIILFLIVVVIIVALLVYAVDQVPLAPPFGNLLKLLIIILGVVMIANRAGML